MADSGRIQAFAAKERLLDELARCAALTDIEVAHSDADDALIAYIDDPEVTVAYEQITKWYA